MITFNAEVARDKIVLWLKDFQPVIFLFLVTRSLIPAIAYYSNLRIDKFDPNYYANKIPHWLGPIFQWDSRLYLSIIRGGYYYTKGEPSNVGFLPLYPMVTKFCAFIIRDDIVAGFLVSNICLLFAGVFLYKLVTLENWGKDAAFKAVLYLFIFPTGFYASLYYAEGIFLLMTIAAVYYGMQRKWARSCCFACLAGMTKPMGLLVIFPLACEYFGLRLTRPFIAPPQQTRGNPLWFLLVPAGILSYMAYLYCKFGDPLAFVNAQKSFGRLDMTYGGTFATFHNYPPFEQILYASCGLTVCMSIVILCVKKAKPAYIVYAVAIMLSILRFGLFDSFQRYTSIIFPVYLALALIGRKSHYVDLFITLLSAMLMSLFVVLFTAGYRMY